MFGPEFYNETLSTCLSSDETEFTNRHTEQSRSIVLHLEVLVGKVPGTVD